MTLKQTPLHDIHVGLGARMVNFAGWHMPVQYSGLIAEHESIRSRAGIFDVSHMGEFLISGPQATDFLEYVLTNTVTRLRSGRSQYTLICNDHGGVIDDAMLYRVNEHEFLLVVNASNVSVVSSWLEGIVGDFDVLLRNCSEDYCLLAVQGPQTAVLINGLCDFDLLSLRRTRIQRAVVCGRDVLIGRTGYTGEDGVEIFIAPGEVRSIWTEIVDRGVTPAGLGARNTLRLEAGMALHGHELSVDINPVEAGLSGIVSFDKGEFKGKAALMDIAVRGPRRRLHGIRITDRAIPRDSYRVHTSFGDGIITSGTFSPTLQSGIGFAFLPPDCSIGDSISVDIRRREWAGEIVDVPFYSNVARWRAK